MITQIKFCDLLTALNIKQSGRWLYPAPPRATDTTDVADPGNRIKLYTTREGSIFITPLIRCLCV